MGTDDVEEIAPLIEKLTGTKIKLPAKPKTELKTSSETKVETQPQGEKQPKGEGKLGNKN